MTLPVLIPAEICEILIPWLKSHEGDIFLGICDFGDLAPVYEALFNEPPQHPSTADGKTRCHVCKVAIADRSVRCLMKKKVVELEYCGECP